MGHRAWPLGAAGLLLSPLSSSAPLYPDAPYKGMDETMQLLLHYHTPQPPPANVLCPECILQIPIHDFVEDIT